MGPRNFAAALRFPSGRKLEACGQRTIAEQRRRGGRGRSRALAEPSASPARLPRRDVPAAGSEVSWEEAGLARRGARQRAARAGRRARATRSRILGRRRGSSGRCSTSRSRSSARSAAAIYANSSPKDCRYVLEHSDAVGVLRRGRRRSARRSTDVTLARTCSPSPDLRRASRARPRATPRANPDALDRGRGAVGEDDLFTFIYTSGTTGPPKACMIRHRNYYEMATCIDRLDGVRRSATT